MPSEPQADAQVPDEEPGRILADRYKLQKCLRRTGTCHLYRAHDVYRDDALLAILPSPGTMQRKGGAAWFESCGKNAVALPPHPNVLTARRLDRDADTPFLLMDAAQGRFWDEAIADGDMVQLDQMLDLAIQVGHGLAWLHHHNFVHHNMKPSNVLLCNPGLVKLWKYGQPDAMTRAYASPEQLEGGECSATTDIWSWAVSVLHMFVGRVVWHSGPDAAGVLRRYVRSGPAVAGIPMMPGRLCGILEKCLRKDPRQRPAGIDEVGKVLEGAYEEVVGTRYVSPEDREAASPAPQENGSGQAEQQPGAAAGERSWSSRRRPNRGPNAGPRRGSSHRRRP